MKTSTLKNRLAKNFTGSKTSIAYRLALKVIAGEKLIRPCYTSGSGRFTSNQDHSFATENLLNQLGIKFETGNDSPRGGQTGKFIKIITKITGA